MTVKLSPNQHYLKKALDALSANGFPMEPQSIPVNRRDQAKELLVGMHFAPDEVDLLLDGKIDTRIEVSPSHGDGRFDYKIYRNKLEAESIINSDIHGHGDFSV